MTRDIDSAVKSISAGACAGTGACAVGIIAGLELSKQAKEAWRGVCWGLCCGFLVLPCLSAARSSPSCHILLCLAGHIDGFSSKSCFFPSKLLIPVGIYGTGLL